MQPVIEVEIKRDRHVDLGMSMISALNADSNEHCLRVNSLRMRPNKTPGPAQEAGVQTGETLCCRQTEN